MMKTNRKLIVCFLSFALLLGTISTTSVSAAKKVSLSSKKIAITKGKSKTIKVKNTKKKVTWKILSGKKCIALKKKGKTAATIRGKKKGKAKVQARIGKKKLTCTVTVKNKSYKSTPTPVTTKSPQVSESPMPSASTSPAVISTPPTGTQTPPVSSNPTNAPTGSHEKDVAVLRALIAEQRGRGATVNEDLQDSEQYIWDNGRLIGINWYQKNLSEKLDVSELTELVSLDCNFNSLSSLDVSSNVKLDYLSCSSNNLSSLKVSNNINLTELECEANDLSSLDISNNVNLTYLRCGYNDQIGRASCRERV